MNRDKIIIEYLIEKAYIIETTNLSYNTLMNSYSQSKIDKIDIDGDDMIIYLSTPESRLFDSKREIQCSKMDFDFWCKENYDINLNLK